MRECRKNRREGRVKKERVNYLHFFSLIKKIMVDVFTSPISEMVD